ncbi:hypothetical protein KPL70_000416 [Citrus sinensis]|nr:hypothetical protein KPL70_000416 [Citrus sinensis]
MVLDSGATHHLINNVKNLAEGKPYIGSQLSLVGQDGWILLAHGIAKGGLYKLLSQDDSDTIFNYESLSLKPSSMLSFLQNKGIVNSLQNSSSLVSITHTSNDYQAKAGIFKPKTYIAVTQNLEPTSVKAILQDSKWYLAMNEEFKAALRAWYGRLKCSMIDWGFQASKSDTFLFIKHVGGDILLILVYGDDILITGSNSKLLEAVIQHLNSNFALKDLGEFNYFLGLEVTPSVEGFHLSQTKYIGDILKKANMLDSKGYSTSMSTSDKLYKDKCAAFENPSLYRSIVSSLQYLLLTRPDTAYTVNKTANFYKPQQFFIGKPTRGFLDICKAQLILESNSFIQARIQTLRMQIQTIKKGSMHMADYFAKVKRIADTLALAGKPVELGDLIMHVLTGLDSSDYESLVTAVLARDDKITLDELYSLLLNHEIRIEQKKWKITSDVMHNMTANVAQRNTYSGKNNGGFQKNYGGNFGNENSSGFSGFNGGASGNSSGQFSNRNNFSNVVCQICYIPGHVAYKCRNKYNSSFVPQKNYGRGNFNSGFRPPGQFGRGRFFNGGGRGPGQFNNNYNSPRVFGFQGGPGFQGNIVHAENSFGTPSAFYSFTHDSSIYAPTETPDNSGQYNASTSSSLPPSNPNVSPELVEDPSWYFDSGATNHITNDLDSFNKPESLFASCAMSHVNKPEVVKVSEPSLQSVFSAVALQSVNFSSPDKCQSPVSLSESSFSSSSSVPSFVHLQSFHTSFTSSYTTFISTHWSSDDNQVKSFKPKTYLSTLLAQPFEPLSISQALADPMWFQAMQEEFQALQNSKTWELVLPDTPVKIVGNKWVFRIKYNSDGSLSRYKARLVVKGFHQTQGVDYTETFSPVVKASTLKKVIYGLKQAPRAWFDRFKDAMTTQWHCQHSKSDSSLFYKWINDHVILVLVYIDDIILTGSNPQLIQQVIQDMHHTFALKDLRDLNYFLGIEVVKPATGLYLSQAKYIADILAKHDMVYSNSDWAFNRDDKKSVAGYAVYLGPNLVSWSSKKQAVVSRSSTKAEYRALAHATSEVIWIQSLLQELQIKLSTTPMMWCDNQGAIALAYNPVYHAKTKHVELDIHFIRDKVAAKSIEVSYVPSDDQSADILTKALSFKQFDYLRHKLNAYPRHFSLRGDVSDIESRAQKQSMTDCS